MPNPYTQIYIQIVFAVKGRQNLMAETWRERLEKYICGIINHHKSKPLAIYCNPDHTQVLIGLHPATAISEMVRDIKANSSKWINENKLVLGKFSWQEGYGAFSYAKSQVDAVVKYIINQPAHHKRSGFREEYLKMLQKAEIDYDERYLFEWYE